MKPLAKLLVAFVAIVVIGHLSNVIAATGSGNESRPATVERVIPFKSGDEIGTGALVLRVGVVLGVVVLIGIAGMALLRKYVPLLGSVTSSDTKREIQLLEFRRLTPRLTLFLVEVRGVQYLLAQSGDRVVPLVNGAPKQQG